MNRLKTNLTKPLHAILFVWQLAQIGIALYGMLVIAYLLARAGVGERWTWVAFANNFVPWLALGNLLLVGIALFSRRRVWLIALQVPGIAAFLLLYGELYLPHDSIAQAGTGSELSVATYNMQAKASDALRVTNLISAVDADIIALHELRPAHAAMIADRLAIQYPYQMLYAPAQTGGIGLLSRYPLLESEQLTTVKRYVRHARFVVDVNGVPVTIHVVHPPSPSNFASPIGYNANQRNRQLASVREQIQSESGPLLLLCDCNMSDQSDAYRALDRVLDDAHREVGRGMGFSFAIRVWPGLILPPIIRIDYVWHNDYFTTREIYVEQDSGTSDHYPVVARLILYEDNGGR
jgi:vancomycin resistance protein VanJ